MRPNIPEFIRPPSYLESVNPPGTPAISSPMPPHSTSRKPGVGMHIKRVTLTSKKNWWMVEMDEEEESSHSSYPATSENDIATPHPFHQKSLSAAPSEQAFTQISTPPPSMPIYRPPHHPTSIFSFPTPTAYSAPPNPTQNLAPCFQGSASELFKCLVKKPDVVQLEINGEMQSNATDVTVQFLAELRVYTTLTRHRNVAAFLGCLENVGMVLEYIEGRTLYDVVIARPLLTSEKKIDYHNQLLDGLTHLHSYGLSHGDLSLLNVQVTTPGDVIKLLDFGRSVSAASALRSPDDVPDHDPFAQLNRRPSTNILKLAVEPRETEQIHPGTRPFSAPEVLRGECQDARLADAYSFGMILVCLDRGMSVDVKPWDQRKDLLPKDMFEACEVFEERAREYLRKYTTRRRLDRADMMAKP